MKKIYIFYIDNSFWINTIILFIVFSFIPINDINPIESTDFLESIRLVQLGSILFIASVFYYKLVRASGYSHTFYTTDKFYCDLIYVTVILGVTFTIHYINWETTDVHSAIKVWEIAAYAVTLLYTFWIWTYSLRKNIFLIIKKKNTELEEKLKFIVFIVVALIILFAITVGHIIITFSGSFLFIKMYSIQLSVILILITYFLFDLISAKVVELTNEKLVIGQGLSKEEGSLLKELNVKIDEYNEEFKFGLKYMDRPMKWVFVIMTGYALYATGIDYFAQKTVMHEMESFFGGAIAFELLLSSVIWAKTKI